MTNCARMQRAQFSINLFAVEEDIYATLIR